MNQTPKLDRRRIEASDQEQCETRRRDCSNRTTDDASVATKNEDAHAKPALSRVNTAQNESDRGIYRTIIDRMEQGVLVFNSQQVLMSNPQLHEVLDCPPELVAQGASFAKFVQFATDRGDYKNDTGNIRLTLESMRQQIQLGNSYVLERQLPNGNLIRVDCHNQGHFAISTYTDITQAKRQSAVFETTIGTMAQGLIVIDENRIVAANNRAAELLDVPSRHVEVGSLWEDLIRYRTRRGDFPDGIDRIKRLRDAFEKRQSYTTETQAKSRTLLTQSRIRHSMMFITLTDVTQARQRELILKEKQEEIHQLANTDVLLSLIHI